MGTEPWPCPCPGLLLAPPSLPMPQHDCFSPPQSTLGPLRDVRRGLGAEVGQQWVWARGGGEAHSFPPPVAAAAALGWASFSPCSDVLHCIGPRPSQLLPTPCWAQTQARSPPPAPSALGLGPLPPPICPTLPEGSRAGVGGVRPDLLALPTLFVHSFAAPSRVPIIMAVGCLLSVHK